MTSTGRPVFSLMGFRTSPNGDCFAAVAPYRAGVLSGEEVTELPCTKQIRDGSEEQAERWAQRELAKQGKAFHGLYVSDLD